MPDDLSITYTDGIYAHGASVNLVTPKSENDKLAEE